MKMEAKPVHARWPIAPMSAAVALVMCSCSAPDVEGRPARPCVPELLSTTARLYALDDEYIYWFMPFAPTGGADDGGAFMRMPKQGGSITVLADGDFYVGSLRGLAVDDAYLYWVNLVG